MTDTILAHRGNRNKMSTYHGRRAPNVSHLLQDLNAVGAHDGNAEETFNMEDDLELFTNTQFYDFDSGQQTDFQAQPVKAAAAAAASATDDVARTAPSAIGEMPNLDFSMTGECRLLFIACIFCLAYNHTAWLQDTCVGSCSVPTVHRPRVLQRLLTIAAHYHYINHPPSEATPTPILPQE